MCPTEDVLFDSADYVFYGIVEKIDYIGVNKSKSEPDIDVYFDIRGNWKGKYGDKPLRTIYNKYSCEGYFFKENNGYILFIKEGEPLSLCDTHEYSKETVEILDEIVKKHK